MMVSDISMSVDPLLVNNQIAFLSMIENAVSEAVEQTFSTTTTVGVAVGLKTIVGVRNGDGSAGGVLRLVDGVRITGTVPRGCVGVQFAVGCGPKG